MTIPKDHEMVTKSEIVKLISYGEDFIDAPEANYYSPFVEVKFVDSNKEDVDFSKGDPITLQIAFFNTVESPESIKKEDIEFVYVNSFV